jgi:hypothetical protein
MEIERRFRVRHGNLTVHGSRFTVPRRSQDIGNTLAERLLIRRDAFGLLFHADCVSFIRLIHECLAITVTPAFNFWPTVTLGCCTLSRGMNKSTCEPNLIMPTLCPRSTISPSLT